MLKTAAQNFLNPPNPMPEQSTTENEIDGEDYSASDLMVSLMQGEIALPVWVRFGSSRHRITPESVRDICRGMLIALEIREAKREGR